jgi:hypothetical protein
MVSIKTLRSCMHISCWLHNFFNRKEFHETLLYFSQMFTHGFILHGLDTFVYLKVPSRACAESDKGGQNEMAERSECEIWHFFTRYILYLKKMNKFTLRVVRIVNCPQYITRKTLYAIVRQLIWLHNQINLNYCIFDQLWITYIGFFFILKLNLLCNRNNKFQISAFYIKNVNLPRIS